MLRVSTSCGQLNQTIDAKSTFRTPLKAGEKFEIGAYRMDIQYHNRVGYISGRLAMSILKAMATTSYTCRNGFQEWRFTSDFEGGQNKQFMGSGEFALAFGDLLKSISPCRRIIWLGYWRIAGMLRDTILL